jgi:DNA uptake protein ComE-like DNA-binding protein
MKAGHRQRGFVLVLTMGVLVVLALAAGYFAERVASAVDLAQQSRQNTTALMDMSNTRAELLYRLATTSFTVQGLGSGAARIALDDRPYRGLGNTRWQMQDNRGLINLNAVEDDRLMRLLGLLGIPAEQRAQLVDTLRDYIDADDLHRLNGAEKDDYLARNLPPPPNHNLATPWQAQGIIGWRDAPQLWQNARLVNLTSTSVANGLNPNTAPAEVLETLPGISADIAQRIIAHRQALPIVNLLQLAEVTGMPTQPFEEIIAVLPSNSLRITQSAPGLPWALQYSVTLTPKSGKAPWQIDYSSRISHTEQPAAIAGALPDLPPRSMAPPEVSPL